MEKHHLFSNFKSDLIAGIVVFFVAVPLCLGIALASGVPLFSGIIAGVIGGIVVGFLSQSQVSVSGPAAGLVAIVLAGITSIGSLEGFFLAVVLAGVIQLVLSLLKAGGIAYFFPSNVIKGMLTAIGIIIIMKQIPHFVGYDKDYEGDFAFWEASGSNSFSSLFSSFDFLHWGVTLAGLVSLVGMVLWDKYKPTTLKVIPGAIVAVVLGLLMNVIFIALNVQGLIIMPEHLVQLPVFESFADVKSTLILPDFTQISNAAVWTVAITIGLVASIETLLTIEATDKIDPYRRVTPTNRELFAQGTGNIISGLIGGLPITSVIVRSSANINSGGRTKISTIFHGILLFIGALFLSQYLNYIPLTSLAAILLVTGYKLANPATFKTMFKKSYYQWVPFVVAVVAIVLTDLLTGIFIGIGFSILGIIITNIRNTSFVKREKINNQDYLKIELAQEVSFLNKATVLLLLDKLEEESKVVIDASKTVYIDDDVIEIIQEFVTIKAPDKNIEVKLTGFKDYYGLENSIEY